VDGTAYQKTARPTWRLPTDRTPTICVKGVLPVIVRVGETAWKDGSRFCDRCGRPQRVKLRSEMERDVRCVEFHDLGYRCIRMAGSQGAGKTSELIRRTTARFTQSPFSPKRGVAYAWDVLRKSDHARCGSSYHGQEPSNSTRPLADGGCSTPQHLEEHLDSLGIRREPHRQTNFGLMS
jgi:hypothetical protein